MKKKLKLSLKERKILYLLRLNSRMPITEIAKRVGCSRELTQYLVKKLERIGVINRYRVIINYNKLNMNVYTIFVKFKNWAAKEVGEVLEKLKKTEGLMRMGYFFGSYDVVITIAAQTIYQIENIVKKIENLLRGKIIRITYHRRVRSFNAPYNSLLSKSEIVSLGKLNLFMYDFKMDSEVYTLNKRESRVLGLLRQNPKIKITKLADKMKCSYSTAKNIINTLVKNNIILGFTMICRITQFRFENQSLFEVLLRFHEDKKYQKKDFEQYVTHNCRNLFYMGKYLMGEFDYKLNISAEHVGDLKNQLNEMNTIFVNNLEIDTILIFGVGEQDEYITKSNQPTQNIFK